MGKTIFVSGLPLALPLICALLTINLAMSILNRAAQQLSVFSVGFPVTLIVGVTVLTVVLPHAGPFLESLFESGLSAMSRVVDGLAEANPEWSPGALARFLRAPLRTGGAGSVRPRSGRLRQIARLPVMAAPFQAGTAKPSSRLAGQAEDADRFAQRARLFAQLHDRTTQLLHQRGVLHRHDIHLRHGRVDLFDAAGLFL